MNCTSLFVLGVSGLASACFGQAPTLHVLPAPLDGQVGGVVWNGRITNPLAVSGDGSTIVGIQPSGAADFPYSAAVRWSGLTGQVIDYLMPDGNLGEGTYSFHRSVNWNGSIHTSRHNFEYIIFINGVASPASQLGQSIISQDSRRILISTGTSLRLVDRASGSTIAQCSCVIDDFTEPSRFSTAGDAFATRQVYWREGHGFVQGNALTPSLTFQAVSGDGRWAYGRHFVPGVGSTWHRFSHEHGVEPVAISSVESVSEHAEVEVSQEFIKTPRHGVESIQQFLTREGINTSALGSNTPYGQLISRDGRTLVGYAWGPDPDVAWSIRFPGNYLCDSIDFNNDGLTNPDDIAAFLSRYSEGPCVPATATCNDIDFNNDTSMFDPEDIEAFLRVYGEGPCIE